MIHPPPLAPYSAALYVPRRDEEGRALGSLVNRAPVLLWGPRLSGKTWLWRRIAERWQAGEAGSAVLGVPLRHFEAAAFGSLDTCLRTLAEHTARAAAELMSDDRGAGRPPVLADPEGHVADVWEGRGSSKTKMNRVLADVLRAAPGPVLIVLDDVDLVRREPFCADFVGLLRGWAESRDRQGSREKVWDRLRLLVAASTDPARFGTSIYQSPFYGLSEPILVNDFDGAEVAALVAQHGLSWSDHDVGRLIEQVGGQPHLLRAALSQVGSGSITLDDLVAGRPLGRGWLTDFLQRHRTRLEADAQLSAGFRALAGDPGAAVPGDVLAELLRQGLVRRGPAGTHPLRGRIYRRLLQTDDKAGAQRRTLFLAHAPADEALLGRLRAHLAILERQGWIQSTHRGQVPPGAPYEATVSAQLDSAEVVLLLVSADLLADAWPLVARALDLHKAKRAIVVPVLLRPCDWQGTPLEALTPLPSDRHPVTRWTDPEDGWADVAQGIRKLVERAVS